MLPSVADDVPCDLSVAFPQLRDTWNTTGQFRIQLATGNKANPGVWTPVNCSNPNLGACLGEGQRPLEQVRAMYRSAHPAPDRLPRRQSLWRLYVLALASMQAVACAWRLIVCCPRSHCQRSFKATSFALPTPSLPRPLCAPTSLWSQPQWSSASASQSTPACTALGGPRTSHTPG
jgi:hypothetical protein